MCMLHTKSQNGILRNEQHCCVSRSSVNITFINRALISGITVYSWASQPKLSLTLLLHCIAVTPPSVHLLQLLFEGLEMTTAKRGNLNTACATATQLLPLLLLQFIQMLYTLWKTCYHYIVDSRFWASPLHFQCGMRLHSFFFVYTMQCFLVT